MTDVSAPRAHPPETTEGWYVLHQVLAYDRPLLRAMLSATQGADARATLDTVISPATDGWSAIVPLIGSRADVMLVHFRASLDDIGEAQRHVAKLALFDARLAQVVELRYFSGLNIDETAAALSVSHTTVERDWVLAKAWLYQRLS